LQGEKQLRQNTKYAVLLIFLAVLTPVGIIIPNLFNAGSAYGEWSTDELNKILGFVPEGILKFANSWSGVFPDYSIAGIAEQNTFANSLLYIVCGFFGLALTVLAVYLILKLICQDKKVLD